MIRLLQPERNELVELHRRERFRGFALEAGAIPSRIIINQSLRNTQGSARAFRWSVPHLILWQEERVVGTIGGKGLLDTEDEVELGYNVALPFRRRSIATRAIAMMCEMATNDGINLLAHVEPDNEASSRALMRNNFRMEAIVRLPDSLNLERWSWSPY